MLNVLLVIHILLAIALVSVVLVQRSEGGALGIGGGGGGFMTGRGTANLLTRVTSVLAVLFFVSCLVLAKLSGGEGPPKSIVDTPPPVSAPGPAPTPLPIVPADPAPPLAR